MSYASYVCSHFPNRLYDVFGFYQEHLHVVFWHPCANDRMRPDILCLLDHPPCEYEIHVHQVEVVGTAHGVGHLSVSDMLRRPLLHAGFGTQQQL
jgi:hypothetical protein